MAIDGPAVTVTNPLSERHAVLRSGLVGSLLDVLALNERHGRADVAIFEVGKGYAKAPDGAPAEWWRLGILLAGSSGAPAWNRPPRPYDLGRRQGDRGAARAGRGRSPSPAGPRTRTRRRPPGRAARAMAPARWPESSASCIRRSSPRWDLRAEHVLVAELAIGGCRPASFRRCA